MTQKLRFLKFFVVLVLVATSVAGTSKKARKTGYYREVQLAQYFSGWACNSIQYVWMPDADDEIDISQEVWLDGALTIPFPDGRITSQYGSTYGTTFMVVNGRIYDYSSPVTCYDPLTDGGLKKK